MDIKRNKLVTILVIVLFFAQTIFGSMPANVAAATTTSANVTVTMTANGQPYDGSKMTSNPVLIEATASTAIEYSTDHGFAWQAYNGPITVKDTGVHHYLFREVGTIPIETANVHIMPSPAEQAITSSADTIYVNEDASTSGDGKSWGSAYKDLQVALNDSKQRVSSGDSVQIFVAEGTYHPSEKVGGSDARNVAFQMQNNVAIYGGFDAASGTRDIEAYPTILSGDIGNLNDNTDNAYHVFYHPSELSLDATAVLDGVTIKDGYANGPVTHSSGGGMYNSSSRPTLTNVTISGNTASAYGGGMYNDDSSPTLTNVTISGNTASADVEASGGGIFNVSSSPTLTNVTISGNTASASAYGGGIFNTNSSSPTLTNVTISGNTASASTDVAASAYAYGGGMYNSSNSSPTLTNVTISGNTTSTSTYASGGGMYNVSSSPTLTNVTISGNTASASGGGMYNNYGSSPTLTNVTMIGNESTGTDKGAIYGGGGAIRNSLIVGNNGEPALTAYTGTIATSILDIDTASNGTIEAKFHNSNTDIFTDTYQLEDIFIDINQLNYRLRANSPAINKGNNAHNTKPTDLDGNPRIQGLDIDLGAYEASPYNVTYEKNGATGDVPVDGMTYAEGKEVTVLSNSGPLVRTGYTFAGWNTEADGSGTDYQVGATLVVGTVNVTLYAQWKPNSYEVNFDTQGGTAVATQMVRYNEQVSAPTAPTKAGHTFTGWYLNNTPFDFKTRITEKMTVTAGWQKASTGRGNGSGGSEANVPPIMTRVIENGGAHYRAILTQENAQTIISQSPDSSERIAQIVFPVEASEVLLTATTGTLNDFANEGTDLRIETAQATIFVPHTSLNEFTEELFFRIVPVKSDKRETIEEKAQQNEQVQTFVGNQMSVNLFGQPVTIETNMQNRPVTITLPIPADVTEEQRQSLFVYIEHSDGTTEVKRGRIVEMAPGVQGFAFDVTHFSTFALLYATEKEEVTEEKIVAPYIKGYPDGTFKPNAAVTRAQMATMLARFLTNGNIPQATSTFADTRNSDAKDAIEFVKKTGLFNGTTQTTFDPNGTITRAQMAAVVARWVETKCAEDDTKVYCEETGKGNVFTDVAASHWAASSIEKVSALGIMSGNSATTFNPNGSLTRAQAVKVLNQLFERPVVKDITESTFRDVPAKHWAIGEIEAAATDMIIKK